MKRKVCVTGGAGFIGSTLVRLLLEKNYRVYVIDDFSTGHESNLVSDKNLTVIHSNLIDHKSKGFGKSYKVIYDCDQVYHLASTVGYFKVLEDPLKCFINNLETTKVVVNACSSSGAKLLFTSSSEVYGNNTPKPLKELDTKALYNLPQTEKDSYAISKWACEFYIQQQMRELGRFVIARLFNTSGARQRADYGMVLPRFVKQSLEDNLLTICGDGLQRRCFCHVEDTARALIMLMENIMTNRKCYNIGNPMNEISIIKLGFLIEDMLGINLNDTKQYQEIPYDEFYKSNNFSDTSRRVPNIEKIKKDTGWMPLKSIEDIIKDNVKWQKSL